MNMNQTQDSQVVHALIQEAIGYAGSAVALAKELNVSRISIWSWEHDEYLPRGRNLLKLIAYIEKKKKENLDKSAA